MKKQIIIIAAVVIIAVIGMTTKFGLAYSYENSAFVSKQNIEEFTRYLSNESDNLYNLKEYEKNSYAISTNKCNLSIITNNESTMFTVKNKVSFDSNNGIIDSECGGMFGVVIASFIDDDTKDSITYYIENNSDIIGRDGLFRIFTDQHYKYILDMNKSSFAITVIKRTDI